MGDTARHQQELRPPNTFNKTDSKRGSEEGSYRRGSKSDEEEPYYDEAMANAERELAEDAEWKTIQQNTFTRWTNEHLRQVDKTIQKLENDFSDGLRLVALIEVLSGKKMPRHNKKPTFRSQKLENVSIALQFLETEGITLVNIDSTDIVDCKLKLIMGLIWTLILHYSISMPIYDGPELGGNLETEKTPKQRLMGWIQNKLPGLPVTNFTKDWQDGKAVGALVDSVAPGLCPDWEDWAKDDPVRNATEAMDLADSWLGVPKLLTPEEIVNPNVDEMSMMTYLSQFPNAKLKQGAPLRSKSKASKVRAWGPGLQPSGVVVNAPATFTIETFGAGEAPVNVAVTGPDNKAYECNTVFNNDRKKTYSCSYFPLAEGEYVVNIEFSGRHIPKSPFDVRVEGFAGDAGLVTVSGPGVEPQGVVINKPTEFQVFTEGAGKGNPDIIVLDPKGKKENTPVTMTRLEDGMYQCEYTPTMVGLHSVNVFFAGNPIPDSPFGVKVSPSSNPGKVWAKGRGLQPHGIRDKETVDFKVYTDGAGEGVAAVNIIGPGGSIVPTNICKKDDPKSLQYTYTPYKEGRHIIMITWSGKEIPRSPFEVNVGPQKSTKIKAYGPGLKGGVVGLPALFTVDTCGETGALGFSIEGPSQAKINCVDNGDGSANVDYLPTFPGEYAVHILCDYEDIPGSPYMAQIVQASHFDPSKVKCFGPGIEEVVMPNESTYFTIDTTNAGNAQLDVSIMDDYGEQIPTFFNLKGEHKKSIASINEAKNLKKSDPTLTTHDDCTYECEYRPRKTQKQVVNVNYGGVAVPGSPFRITVDDPTNPSMVKVYGDGVEPGILTGRPTSFTIDCSQAGPGNLTVAINNDKQSVPIHIKNNGDNTFNVGYSPKNEGLHFISIHYDERELPQSPISVNIGSGLESKQVIVADLLPEAFVNCTNVFSVDTSNFPAETHPLIKVDITSPDGHTLQNTLVGPINPLTRKIRVSYIPVEEGKHSIDVFCDDIPTDGTPYTVNAIYGSDPSKVKAYGDGLENGIVNEENQFTIETINAGKGGLGLAIEGPSEAKMTCKDNTDGSCTVDYVPTEKGNYDISVKFDDQHITGSPFNVLVEEKNSKEEYISPGNIHVNLIKARKLIKADIFGKSDPYAKLCLGSQNFQTPTINNSQEPEWKYEANFHVPEKNSSSINIQVFDSDLLGKDKSLGTLKLDITQIVNNQGLPGVWYPLSGVDSGEILLSANFTVDNANVSNPTNTSNGLTPSNKSNGLTPSNKTDPTKVTAYGPGLEEGKIVPGEPTRFKIDCSQTQPDKLNVNIINNGGIEIPTSQQLKEIEPDVYELTYVPPIDGEPYQVNISYGSEDIPGSPFIMDYNSDLLSENGDKEIYKEPTNQKGIKGLKTAMKKGPTGELHLNLIKARDLIKTDIMGKSDPYAILMHGSQKFKTDVIKNNQNPEWNFEVNFKIPDADANDINIQLYDSDKFGKDKSIGSVNFPVSEVIRNGEVKQGWYPLNGVKSGKVLIKGDYSPFNGNYDSPDELLENVYNQRYSDDDKIKKENAEHPNIGAYNKVVINLLKAKDLIRADIMGKSDPYAIITHGGQKYKTNVVKNNLNPEWNYTAEFKIPDGGDDNINIEIYDSDKFGKDKSLGFLKIYVDDIINKVDSAKGWQQLDGVKSGQVLISTDCMSIGETNNDNLKKKHSRSNSKGKFDIDHALNDNNTDLTDLIDKDSGYKDKYDEREKSTFPEYKNENDHNNFQKLNVKLIRAKDLIKTDIMGKSDPYAILKYGNQAFKTNIVKNNQNPEWNFDADFNFPDSEAEYINIQLYDSDKFGKDKPLGSVNININDAINNEEIPNGWYPLTGVKSGQVLLASQLTVPHINDRNKKKSSEGIDTKSNKGQTNKDEFKKSLGHPNLKGSLEPDLGTVAINLLKAKDLIKADLIGKSDPYALLTYGDQKYKTNVIKNNLNPEWNYTAEFNIPDGNDNRVNIEIYDSDKFSKDKSLGFHQINIDDIINKKEAATGWQLLNGVKSGQILISTDYFGLDEDHNDLKIKRTPSKQRQENIGNDGKNDGSSNDKYIEQVGTHINPDSIGKLNVKLIKAKDLIKTDIMGKSDPYAILMHGNQKFKTNIVKNSQNPEWNYDVNFNIPDPEAEDINIQLYDSDKFGKDKSLGSASFNVNELITSGKILNGWYPLNGVKSGQVLLSSQFLPPTKNNDTKITPSDEIVHHMQNTEDPHDSYGEKDIRTNFDSITFELIKAKDLIKADIMGKSDPYATISYGTQRFKTNIVKNNLNPEWNYTAEFKIPEGDDKNINVEIYDSDKLGKHKSLGFLQVDIDDIINKEEVATGWQPLNGVKSGQVLISTDCYGTEEDKVNSGKKKKIEAPEIYAPKGIKIDGDNRSKMYDNKDIQLNEDKDKVLDGAKGRNLNGAKKDGNYYDTVDKLNVKLIKAKDLIKTDIMGKSDPYAILMHGTQKFKTNVIRNNQNPEWNYNVDFSIPDPVAQDINIQLYDADKFGKDKSLGSVNFNINDVINSGEIARGWYPLNGVKSGQVYLEGQIYPSEVNKLAPSGKEDESKVIGKDSIEPDTESVGKIHFNLIKAKDLMQTDRFSKPDPYAIISCENQTYKSKVIKNNENPEWNDSADLNVPVIGSQKLIVELFDSDKKGKDISLGSSIFSVDDIVRSGGLPFDWHPLDDVKSGAILVSATFDPNERPHSRQDAFPKKEKLGNKIHSFVDMDNNDKKIPKGDLHIQLIGAKDLPNSDFIGKPDPFAVITLGTKSVKTNCIKNTENPEWNFGTDFKIDQTQDFNNTLCIDVFDRETLGKDKPIGNVKLDLYSLISQPLAGLIPLDNTIYGELMLSTNFIPHSNSEYLSIDKDNLDKQNANKIDGSEHGHIPHKSKGDQFVYNNEEAQDKLNSEPRYIEDNNHSHPHTKNTFPQSGKVQLSIMQAKDLISSDIVGKSDPYVIITHGNQTYKTEVMKNTENPEWNCQIDLLPDPTDNFINVKLFDHDKLGKDKCLGSYKIDINQVIDNEYLQNDWYPLDGVKKGQINMSAKWMPEVQILTQAKQYHTVQLDAIPLPSKGGKVEAIVTTPANTIQNPSIVNNNNGTVAITYQPDQEGLHYLDVKYNNDHVQGSPFKFNVTKLDNGNVVAYGPGLTHGVCGEPGKFSICTQGTGAGGLSLAVEGPSKAEITCHDNKDGTVNVSYQPTAPGEYKITAKFADKHIPGSPFTAKITGEGKKRNQISVGSSSELSLPGNLSESDLRALKAYIESPSGCTEQCYLKKLPKGNIGISFTPREVGEHLVSVKRNGKHITNSPFKIVVNRQEVGDASRVKVTGDGLTQGKTHTTNRFQINTKSAGYGGLSLSIEGPSKAEIDCVDNEDGTLDVAYTPTEPGFYVINIKFADFHVPGSPYQVPISGTGTEKQTENIKHMREAVPVTQVGSQCRLTFKMPGILLKDLSAIVRAPQGNERDAEIQELEPGLYSVNFVPYCLGIHTVTVRYREMDIPGSPFQFTVGPLQDGGAHCVHAGGSGLQQGISGHPAEFNVWTREAGPGSLAISVEGPSKAQIDFKDRKDGSCYVSYIVNEPGEYCVGIRFNDDHIPQSPYKVLILPTSDHADKVLVTNLDSGFIVSNTPQSFLLHKNGADGNLECAMVSPSGREDDCFISQVGQDEYSVRFVPKEEGTHHLHAKLNGVHVPGSPFKINVGNTNKDGAVMVYGNGIDKVHIGEKASFIIDTTSVGAGTLSVTVDGPSKVDMDCIEMKQGYQVSYTPTVPGDYFVTVKYNGHNVEGSPFNVAATGGGIVAARAKITEARRESSSVTMETIQHTAMTSQINTQTNSRTSSRSIPVQPSFISDASKVLCEGAGIENPVLGKQNSFHVDCSKAGSNVLFVGVFGPETPCDEVYVKHQGDKQYGVKYKLKQKGQYILYVKWGDEHIPGSPFHVQV